MHPLATKFQEIFGTAPELIASAPGRVNLIGEHVDFLDGFVLPFAISDATTVAIAKNSSNKIRCASIQKKGVVSTIDCANIAPKSGEAWARYPIGVLWSLGIETGIDILVDGQVPLGAGLSSSAALECADIASGCRRADYQRRSSEPVKCAPMATHPRLPQRLTAQGVAGLGEAG